MNENITIEEPGYTQIPNIILDSMADLETPLLRVLLFMCRKTFGFHTEYEMMSRSFIAKHSGSSESSVSNVITLLLERGLVKRVPNGDSFDYKLVLSKASKPSLKSLKLPSKKKGAAVPQGDTPPCPAGGRVSVPQGDTPPVPQGDTYKETPDQRNKETPDGKPSVVSQTEPKESRQSSRTKELTDGYGKLYAQHIGRKYPFRGAADGQAVKRLLSYDCSVQEILDVANKCFKRRAEKFPFDSVTSIASFASQWSKILGKIPLPRKSSATSVPRAASLVVPEQDDLPSAWEAKMQRVAVEKAEIAAYCQSNA